MAYNDISYAVASKLFWKLNRGDLLNEENTLVKHTGLSSGQKVIYDLCCAFHSPDDYKMPRPDDLAFLSPDLQQAVIQAFSELFTTLIKMENG